MSRLPVVSSDGNTWGTILNDFLSQSLNADGSIKNLFVNVKNPAYGAKGDGFTDDTTAIQAAINSLSTSGGVVFFPMGIYVITASLIIDNDNIGLIGFGQRGSAPTIQIGPTADPTYALIVGNTKNVNSCFVSGLTFLGRNNTTSTGKGINFRSHVGKMSQVKVGLFGGNGIDVNSFSGTIFEVFFEDIDLLINGMNATTHGDNMVISGGASDCEYHRVISEGDNARSTTVNGVTINGASNQKFVDCHCYFSSHDGFYIISSTYTQIIGGEYENNAVNGIESSGVNNLISGVSCFLNVNTDISCYAQCIIVDSTCTSTTFASIYASSASGGVIADNVLSGSLTAIQLDTGSSGFTVHDNKCSATGATVMALKCTNSDIHDNLIAGATGNIVEQTGAQGNHIHSNTLSGGTITQVGTTTKIRNNPGFNPRGSITPPAVPASTVTYTNILGVDCTVYIKGGTLTVISIGGTATGITAAAAAGTAHIVRVPVGQTIAITYSVAPTWTWFGD